MSWSPRNPFSSSCARQPLEALLSGRLGERAGARMAAHLDTCEACQQRLTQLAAEPTWWFDASRWLEPDTPDIDPCVDDLGGCDLDEFDAFPGNERDLLESGLLAKSDNPAMIGSLGRYEVKRVLGAGGTGIVLQAIDTELSRTVAIKVLAPTLAAHGPARKRFARESQAVAAVAHENVVAVHHVEGGGRVPYLVMQYVEGDSLQQRVIRDGPLDTTTTLRMAAQLAAALSAAHDQGLVHRDVKPANILVGPAGQRVWITDFGLARAVDDASLTRTGFIAGTPHYMSPEQARGATVRASSDLFGLGGVVYFMLTGRPPFRAERTLAILNRICTEPHRPVREVNPSVPPAVAGLVDRLLAKSTHDRFANADAVRTQCLRLLASHASPDGDSPFGVAVEPVEVAPTRRRVSVPQAIGATVALTLLALCATVIVHLSGQLIGPSKDKIAYADVEPLATEDELQDVQSAAERPRLSNEIAANSAARVAPSSFVDAAETVPVADSAGKLGRTKPPQRFRGPRQSTVGPPKFDPYSSSPTGSDHASSRVSPEPSAARNTSPFGVSRLPAANGAVPEHPTARLPTIASVAPSSNDGNENDGNENLIVDELSVWQSGFQELEDALLLFDFELANSHAQHAANVDAGPVVDPFDDTIQWMEATADTLGIGSTSTR